MSALSPTEAGQCPAEFCRISPPQAGNAPLRLRLTAHPPPLAGEALGSRRPEGSPARGSVGVRRLRGAAPCPANTLPGCLKPPRPCGAALTQNHSAPFATLPGGRSRPPYNITYTCNGAGSGSLPPCVRADARIGPPTGLAKSCRFRITSRSRPQCRAGVFARRLGPSAAARFRDDACIAPTEAYGKALPGVAGYLRRKVAMHPSVCAERRIHLPLQGRLCKRLPPKRLPCGSIQQAPAPIPIAAQRAAPSFLIPNSSFLIPHPRPLYPLPRQM